jgi:hypothetical protein
MPSKVVFVCNTYFPKRILIPGALLMIACQLTQSNSNLKGHLKVEECNQNELHSKV